MSTRSGPYLVTICGYEWLFEHDMMSNERSLDSYGDVFRIYGPGLFMEVATSKFDAWASGLPDDLVAAIRREFDLPNSYCIEHARLWARGEECPHCPKRYTS